VRLLRAVIAEARDRGVLEMHLEVRAGNEAVQLYRREGFDKVGERRNYYRGKRGKRLMHKPLRGSSPEFLRK
jgi:ribosomal-protein-alanine N-acetyltransferase